MRSDAILAKMLETPEQGGGGGDIKEEVKNLETILSNKIDKEITKARESAGADTKDNESKAQTDTKTLNDGGKEDGKDNESKENS